MKNLLLILFLIISYTSLNAQTKATTENGKKVVLFDDGTWKYEHEMTDANIAINPLSPSITTDKLINDSIVASSSKFEVFNEVSPRLERFFGKEKSKVKCSAIWANNKGEISLKLEFLVPVGDANRYFGYSLQDRTIDLHLSNGEQITLSITKDVTQKFVEKWNVSYFEGSCIVTEEQLNELLKQTANKMTINWKKRSEEYNIPNNAVLKKNIIDIL